MKITTMLSLLIIHAFSNPFCTLVFTFMSNILDTIICNLNETFGSLEKMSEGSTAAEKSGKTNCPAGLATVEVTAIVHQNNSADKEVGELIKNKITLAVTSTHLDLCNNILV
jgi:hypothetical protein